jgi:hypothetical protein
MRTFIQLLDGIGYATVITPTDAPDHSVTPDNVTAIEVFTDNPDQFLNKRYDEVTKSWSEPELFIYGDVDKTGRIIEIRQTYLPAEVIGKPIITPEVRPDWLWINQEWVIPEVIDVQEVEQPLSIGNTEETEEERLARVAAANQK